MRKILVTGAAGFIGFHLAKRLIADGKMVTEADRRKLPGFNLRRYPSNKF